MRAIAPVVVFSLILVGCGSKEVADKAQVSKDLKNRGTMDLMKEISKDKYDAPKDGKLTESQIQMYLKVREKERVIAQTAREEAEKHAKAADAAGKNSISGFMEGLKTLGSAADLLTADIRAAHDLGYNTQEYTWVKGQILEASGSELTQNLSKAMTAQMDAAYAQTKKAYDEAKDEQTKQMYKQMLDGYDQSKKEAEASKTAEDPHIAYNRELLSKHEDALNALASELAKWGGKEQDVKKAVSEARDAAKKQQ